MAVDNCTTKYPSLPLNAQHSPGCTPGYYTTTYLLHTWMLHNTLAAHPDVTQHTCYTPGCYTTHLLHTRMLHNNTLAEHTAFTQQHTCCTPGCYTTHLLHTWLLHNTLAAHPAVTQQHTCCTPGCYTTTHLLNTRLSHNNTLATHPDVTQQHTCCTPSCHTTTHLHCIVIHSRWGQVSLRQKSKQKVLAELKSFGLASVQLSQKSKTFR